MNPKLILCLALVLSGGLFGCCHAQIYPTNDTPDAIFRVVVQPAKTQVHIRESFWVALIVENLTTTNQYVHKASQDWESWESQWQTSNPNIYLIHWDPAANVPFTIKIPPGGAYTNETQMSVEKPVSTNKLSFKVGFTPADIKKTYWSDKVTIEIIP
jgi:hypothetical protein